MVLPLGIAAMATHEAIAYMQVLIVLRFQKCYLNMFRELLPQVCQIGLIIVFWLLDADM